MTLQGYLVIVKPESGSVTSRNIPLYIGGKLGDDLVRNMVDEAARY